ncbi:MAG: hypothetical protein LH465_06085 [Sphingomonas bacterium]|nr:hypothetical protein [Sphingomonas bacterium]
MKKPSKPSAAPNPASGRAPPVVAWPIPQPGDVLSYAYLWSHEADAGQEEGLKDRPVVIVVAVQNVHGNTQLLVAPITHSEPRLPQSAIEIPKIIKRELGLDEARSWIILNELNRFVWPGPDIRIVAGGSGPYHGAIPDHLFTRMRDAIVERASANRLRMTKRTE